MEYSDQLKIARRLFGNDAVEELDNDLISVKNYGWFCVYCPGTTIQLLNDFRFIVEPLENPKAWQVSIDYGFPIAEGETVEEAVALGALKMLENSDG